MEALRAVTYSRSPPRFGRHFSGTSTISISSSSTSSSSTSSTQTPPPGKPYKFAPLSTPSPSAGANGDRVDVEIEKLRRLSQDLGRSDDEDSLPLNGIISPTRRSPTPKATTPPFSPFKHIYNNNNDSYTGNQLASNVNGNGLTNGGTTEGGSNRFHYKRARSPLRDSPIASVLAEKKPEETEFLANTFPDLPSYKMPSQRRFSEDVNFRRPLATLHEDEVVARRRFSEGVRKKSLDTSGVMDDVYKHQRRMSEAGVRRLSDASIVLTEDTDSFIIGDRVWVGGTKSGVISYIGDTQFAPGEWAGVTLDEPIGKNDGSVGGIRYFQCEAKKGVFSRLTRLSLEPLTDIDIEIRAARSSLSSELPKTNGTPSTPARKVTPAPTPKATPVKSSSPAPVSHRKPSTGPASSSSEPKIGDRVVVASAAGGVRHGWLRFIGRTDFAEGTWAGVELDEPNGKNDGSVAGKKYFSCRDKYGLFAPFARVSKFGSGGGTTPRRSAPAAVQTPRHTIQRSTSRESLGASSVASSTASSSVRGSRRPSKPSSSSIIPSTKALQETLAEKTQHVEQLLRERDMERGELARMAAGADEATRSALEMKTQLSKLQEESEERLHDCGERIRTLERERDELVTRLDDRQRDLDDISFRLEEEAISKSDLESLGDLTLTQSTSDTERIKKMEKELEEARRRLKDRGREEFEAEELEISLRASVEELQVKVMDIEKEKEDADSVVEKQTEELQELKTLGEALRNTISEREQKIKLLESSQEEDRARSADWSSQMSAKSSELSTRDAVISEKESKIQELQRGLESKTRELEDGLVKIQDLMKGNEKERSEKEALQKEINEIREQLESGTGEATTLMSEVSRLKEDLRETTSNYQASSHQVTELESQRMKLEGQLEGERTRVAQREEELTSRLSQRDQQIKDIKEGLEEAMASLVREKESREHEVKDLDTRSVAKDEKYQEKLLELEKEINNLENRVKEKASQHAGTSERLSAAEVKIVSLEALRDQLQEQVNVSLASTTDSSQQLATLSRQLQDKNKELEDKDNKVLGVEKHLLDRNMQLEEKDKQLEKKVKELEDTRGQLSEKETEINKERKVRAEDKEGESSARQREKEQYEKEVESFKQKLQEIETEVSKKSEEIEQQKKQHLTEQEELVKKKDLELYELQEQVMMKEGEVAELGSKVKSLEDQVSALLSDTSSKQGNMEASLALLKAEQEQLTKEKEEVLRRKEEVELKVSSLEEENLKLRTEREANLLAVTERDKKVVELKGEVENLMANFTSHREGLQKQLQQAHQDKTAMAEFQKTFEGELAHMKEVQKNLAVSQEERSHLETEKGRLEEEIAKLMKGIEEEKSNLVKEKARLEEQAKKFSSLENQCSSLVEEKRRAEEEIRAKAKELKVEKEQWIEERNKLEEDIRTLKTSEEERRRLGGDLQRLESELTKMTQIKENNTTLSTELERIREERRDLETNIRNMVEELKIKTVLEDDNLRLSSELKNVSDENHKIKSEVERLENMAVAHTKEMEANHSREKCKVKTLEEEKQKADVDRGKLQVELNKLMQVEVEKKEVESKNKTLVQNMEELKISHEKHTAELDMEKFNLVEEVVSLQDKLSGIKVDMAENNKRAKVALEEAEATNILRAKVNLLEKEKRRMESKIVDLQVERASTEITNIDSDSFVEQLKDEKDQLEGQVNFLNSIIVDMQRKNDELKTRLEIFQLGNIPDDTKANMNGSSPPGRHAVAPRMFCDICDIFDAHETEDCPRQASDSPPPSQHHGDRGASRPYCDTCEVFGHKVGECNEDETF